MRSPHPGRALLHPHLGLPSPLVREEPDIPQKKELSHFKNHFRRLPFCWLRTSSSLQSPWYRELTSSKARSSSFMKWSIFLSVLLGREDFFCKLFCQNHQKEVCCCCSVARSCLTLCDPRDCSTPAFPVLHYFPEFVQTHVHWRVMGSKLNKVNGGTLAYVIPLTLLWVMAKWDEMYTSL